MGIRAWDISSEIAPRLKRMPNSGLRGARHGIDGRGQGIVIIVTASRPGTHRPGGSAKETKREKRLDSLRHPNVKSNDPRRILSGMRFETPLPPTEGSGPPVFSSLNRSDPRASWAERGIEEERREGGILTTPRDWVGPPAPPRPPAPRLAKMGGSCMRLCWRPARDRALGWSTGTLL